MVENNEILEHVYIAPGSFRNFSGVATAYNKSGERKFSVFLPEEVANDLEDIGWYIKRKPPYREGGDPQNQLDIAIGFDRWPPEVKIKADDGTVTYLNKDSIGILDSMDIEDARVEIRPYNWDVNGMQGLSAGAGGNAQGSAECAERPYGQKRRRGGILMRLRYCDICGGRVEGVREDSYVDTEVRSGIEKRGLFLAEYYAPVINQRGEVIDYTSTSYGFDMCYGCRHTINKAVWDAITPILERRRKKAVIAVEKFPMEKRVYDPNRDNDEDGREG